MNIGKGRWHSKYICDKCKKEIPYVGQKGFVGINHYSRSTYRDQVYKKSFDLCAKCEKEFRKWLNSTDEEIDPFKKMISRFPVYEE